MYNVHTPHRRMHICLYACTYKPTHNIHTRLMAAHYAVSAYGKQYSSLSHTHSLCAQRKNNSCMWMWSFAWHCTAMPLYRASADQRRSIRTPVPTSTAPTYMYIGQGQRLLLTTTGEYMCMYMQERLASPPLTESALEGEGPGNRTSTEYAAHST